MVKAERRALRNKAHEATGAGEKQDPPCRHGLRCTIYGRTCSMMKIQAQQNSGAILLDSSNVNEGFRASFRRSTFEADAAKSACERQEYSKDDTVLLQERRDARSMQHMYGKERVQGSTRLNDKISCFQQRAARPDEPCGGELTRRSDSKQNDGPTQSADVQLTKTTLNV